MHNNLARGAGCTKVGERRIYSDLSAFKNWLLIGVTRDKYHSTNLWFHRFSGNFRKVEKVTSDPLDSAIQSDIRKNAPGVDNQHEKNNLKNTKMAYR